MTDPWQEFAAYADAASAEVAAGDGGGALAIRSPLAHDADSTDLAMHRELSTVAQFLAQPVSS